MRIVVDFEVCQSHGLCTRAAPEIFELADDGSLHLKNEQPSDALRAQIEEAAAECPTGAIAIET
jgi:ferredoxin